ncbi:MAG: HlyD family type I secretion periplasmic adaptor subunit [Marinibacterium sp.]
MMSGLFRKPSGKPSARADAEPGATPAPGADGPVRLRLGPGERALGIFAGAGLLVVLGLFHIVTIGSAVIATGQVVVQGKPRPVQSLETGVVEEIDVQDGDHVAAGEVVVRLDRTMTEINQSIIRGRLAELLARRARLEAEQQKLPTIAPLDVPPGLDAADVAGQLAGQQELFRSRRAVLEAQIAQLRERIAQHESEISGAQAQISATEDQIALVAHEVANLQVLSDKGLVPESRLLELQGREASLTGQLAQRRSDLERTRNKIRDAELKMLQTEREFHEQVVTELRDVTARADENLLELARITETLARLDVRAPVGGIVHEMQIRAAGSVVAAQETLLTLIPVSDGVEFELRVAPDAIDTVYVGQAARLRFPAFNQRTTPELHGTVASVSPDSVTDPYTGQSFYRVTVDISDAELARLKDAELIPGMPLEAFLQTGERSVLNFLIKPFTDQFSHAFRES